MLSQVVAKIDNAGWEIINVDCSIIAETPKILNNKENIETIMSRIISAPFSIKGKRPEGFEHFSGVACFAISLLKEKNE